MADWHLSLQISTKIDQKLYWISKTFSKQLIFRINNLLRMTCEEAYEPKLVSIGPYHRGKNNLKKMEEYKLEYLQGILKRQNESSSRRYIDSLVQDEEEARSYYSEQVSLSSEEFVEMMLLDGCFIVEFLREYERNDHDDGDPIFKMDWILKILRRDLLLFENQIPFFILVKLFDMTKISGDNQEKDMISLAVFCLNDFIVGDTIISKSYPSSHIKSDQPEILVHLLNLMYESWFYSSSAGGDDDDQNASNSDQEKRPEFSCITLGKLCCDNNTRQQQKEDPNDIVFIKSVSELKQYGIEFVKSEQSTSWVDIKFENGEIIIPPLVIQDDTESILRNLIAYEQYMLNLGHSGKFVTDYITFMDFLINNPMDVQELRLKGIIQNLLGDDKQVTDMFNKLGSASISRSNLKYQEIFKKVNEHCKHNSRISAWNSWKSEFNNTYFKNPWSIISLLAAIILLVLTLIQTIFSILQQFKKDPMVVCNCK